MLSFCHVQVRATAVLGVPTPERLVYDNLDLLVHPMAVSFTDEQLNQLWVSDLGPLTACCRCVSSGALPALCGMAVSFTDEQLIQLWVRQLYSA